MAWPEPADYRAFFGSVPTPVAVVTTADAAGRPQGFTCNAFAAVSPLPPRLLVCVDRSSRTLPALLDRRVFVLHLLAEGGEEMARTFASRAGDKLAGLPWTSSRTDAAVPVLQHGVLAHAECSVERVVGAGDHQILIARMEGLCTRPRRPVLYQRGTFRTWDDAEEPVTQA